MTIIRTMSAAADMDSIRLLFREYAASLSFNLCFQDFEQELASLPGPYAAPSGCLLLATLDGEPAGCVALKRLNDRAGEMKRLFVRAHQRGSGLGRVLAERIIEEAGRIGYRAIRLDTIPAEMARAVQLYRALGFQEVPAYTYNPIAGAMYMELQLGKNDGDTR